MNLLETHFYDGKLVAIDTIDQIIQLEKLDLTSTKKELFEELSNKIRKSKGDEQLKVIAIETIKLITRDIRQPGNHDITNGIYADDVLYLICMKMQKSNETDILVYLTEQLFDVITSGQCAQGRCTRLFQVLRTIE